MKVTVLYLDGCPHWQLARARARLAAEALGCRIVIEARPVELAEEAAQLQFTGSPTLLIDGVDPFELRAAFPALGCRLYQTNEGLQGAPSQADLEEVISRRAQSARS